MQKNSEYFYVMKARFPRIVTLFTETMKKYLFKDFCQKWPQSTVDLVPGAVYKKKCLYTNFHLVLLGRTFFSTVRNFVVEFVPHCACNFSFSVSGLKWPPLEVTGNLAVFSDLSYSGFSKTRRK